MRMWNTPLPHIQLNHYPIGFNEDDFIRNVDELYKRCADCRRIIKIWRGENDIFVC